MKPSKTYQIVNGELDKCGNCESTEFEKKPSVPWTGAIYCSQCDSLTVITYPDRMGGNYTSYYEVYIGAKKENL